MGLIWFLFAALWGVAEASVFFIVPDVVITYAAVRFGLNAALRLAFVTAVAASIAGAFMWWWGASNPDAARGAMLLVPAIGIDLLAKAHADMTAADWAMRLFLGALTGTPYKLYAVEAGAAHIDLLLFVALSIPARLLRLVLTAGLAAAGNALFKRWGIQRYAVPTLALAWAGVYVTYWTLRVFS